MLTKLNEQMKTEETNIEIYQEVIIEALFHPTDSDKVITLTHNHCPKFDKTSYYCLPDEK
jgi:hypothetical protein